jgi:Sec-independent protein translocase protein TatA
MTTERLGSERLGDLDRGMGPSVQEVRSLVAEVRSSRAGPPGMEEIERLARDLGTACYQEGAAEALRGVHHSIGRIAEARRLSNEALAALLSAVRSLAAQDEGALRERVRVLEKAIRGFRDFGEGLAQPFGRRSKHVVTAGKVLVGMADAALSPPAAPASAPGDRPSPWMDPNHAFGPPRAAPADETPRCATCGGTAHMTIETLPPQEVCCACGAPWKEDGHG